MKARVATLFVVLLTLVACGAPNKLTSGTVVDKRFDDQDIIYHPGYYQSGTETCTGGYGSIPRSCTRTPGYYVPGYNEVQPPKWTIQVKGQHGEDQLTEWHSVSEHDYNCIRIGKWWVHDKDPCVPG